MARTPKAFKIEAREHFYLTGAKSAWYTRVGFSTERKAQFAAAASAAIPLESPEHVVAVSMFAKHGDAILANLAKMGLIEVIVA